MGLDYGLRLLALFLHENSYLGLSTIFSHKRHFSRGALQSQPYIGLRLQIVISKLPLPYCSFQAAAAMTVGASPFLTSYFILLLIFFSLLLVTPTLELDIKTSLYEWEQNRARVSSIFSLFLSLTLSIWLNATARDRLSPLTVIVVQPDKLLKSRKKLTL